MRLPDEVMRMAEDKRKTYEIKMGIDPKPLHPMFPAGLVEPWRPRRESPMDPPLEHYLPPLPPP